MITFAQGEGYVFCTKHLGLSVCLFVCSQQYVQTRERILCNFQDMWDLVEGIVWNILRMFH